MPSPPPKAVSNLANTRLSFPAACQNHSSFQIAKSDVLPVVAHLAASRRPLLHEVVHAAPVLEVDVSMFSSRKRNSRNARTVSPPRCTAADRTESHRPVHCWRS